MVVLLGRHQSPRTRRLRQLLSDQLLANVFNPSMLQLGDRTHLTFRHWGASREDPFSASHLVVDAQGGVERRDLSAHALNHGAARVADPKLLRLGGDAWVTFNDGWSATRNRLFLMQLTPVLGPPRECVFAGRSAVEKNWAFFLEEGRLKALYSLQPPRILEAAWPPSDGSPLMFEEPTRDSDRGSSHPTGLTIGPQAVVRGRDLHVIAHEKWHIGKWRAYVGRSAIVRRSGPTPALEVSQRRLVHSARSVLGARTRHNPNLLSCTYISGMSIEGEHALLAYGINDVDYGFAELPLEML